MAKVREIKNRIVSVQSTKKITQAMKMVAAAKLNRACTALDNLQPYIRCLHQIRDQTLLGKKCLRSPYTKAKEDSNKALLIVIGSDRGLCGGFNTALIKKVESSIKQFQQKQQGIELLPIGKKIYSYAKRTAYDHIPSYVDLFSKLDADKTNPIIQHILKAFTRGAYEKVMLFYNTNESGLETPICTKTILPITLPQADEETVPSDVKPSYIYEPSQEEVYHEVIPKLIRLNFYQALLTSLTAEHKARMTTMTQATDNADSLLKTLQLTYNRTRQSNITKEILEIIGGAEALSEGH